MAALPITVELYMNGIERASSIDPGQTLLPEHTVHDTSLIWFLLGTALSSMLTVGAIFYSAA
jgi:hypothetical protein